MFELGKITQQVLTIGLIERVEEEEGLLRLE